MHCSPTCLLICAQRYYDSPEGNEKQRIQMLACCAGTFYSICCITIHSRCLLKCRTQPLLPAPASSSTVTWTIGQLQTLKSGRICFVGRFLATSLTYPRWLAGYVIAAVSWSLSAAAGTPRVGTVLASLSDWHVLATSTKATDTL